MGRPSIETKRKKRKKHKKRRKGRNYKLSVDEYSDVSLDQIHVHHNSPLHNYCPSDSSSNSSTAQAPDNHQPRRECTAVTEIGDKDLELLEMNIYDTYRQEDGAPYSYQYLVECREKLMRKHTC